MTTDTYWIWFRTDNYPDKPVKTFIETSLACGLQTAQSGDESFFDRYQTNQHDIVRDTDKYDIETVMDEITAADGGKLYFTHNESAFIINIRTLDSDADRPTPNVNLRLGKYDIKSTDIDLILDWIESISEAFDVTYALGGWDWKVADLSTSVAEDLTHLPWIAVFAPDTVTALGGRDYVLNTPTWKVQELDTGHIMIVQADSPYNMPVDEDSSPEHYLLDN